jgi:hypothetical protein
MPLSNRIATKQTSISGPVVAHFTCSCDSHVATLYRRKLSAKNGDMSSNNMMYDVLAGFHENRTIVYAFNIF